MGYYMPFLLRLDLRHFDSGSDPCLVCPGEVSGTFQRYLRVPLRRGKTGSQVARELLDNHGLYDVRVGVTQGHLTDHYDPRSRVLRLSQDVYT